MIPLGGMVLKFWLVGIAHPTVYLIWSKTRC